MSYINTLKKNKYLPIVLYLTIFLILGTIYFYYAITSTGYDDEFWNIGILENTSWPNIVKLFFSLILLIFIHHFRILRTNFFSIYLKIGIMLELFSNNFNFFDFKSHFIHKRKKI